MHAAHAAAIGDFVWNDLDADGIQDTGEPGLAGVTVSLLDGAAGVVATTTTAAGGFFAFTGLSSGDYALRFSGSALGGLLPTLFQQGSDAALDSDVRNLGGSVLGTDYLTLVGGETYSDTDAGFYQPDAQLGDFVWNDLNGNGIQDPGEPGIVGVTVSLLDAVDSVIATTTTDAGGLFQFSFLPAGLYALAFEGLSAGFVPTAYQQGADPLRDSDVYSDAGTFRTALINLGGVEHNLSADAGFTMRVDVPVPPTLWLIGAGLALARIRRRDD